MFRKASLCFLFSVLSFRVFAISPAEIDALVAKEMTKKGVPGLSLAVRGGSFTYSRGYGKADIENDVAATSATVYRLASISKTFTAIAVLQLAEAGKLDLDKPIQTYCPAFPAKSWPINARQLLGHLAGVRAYTDAEGDVPSALHFNDVVTPLAIFKNDPLLHEPGTAYAYTTYGYNILGCAVEGASGEKFADYVVNHVFKIAGMETARTDDAWAIIPHRAQGYRKDEEILRNAKLADTSNKIPGGGFVSTVGDLVKYAAAIGSGKLLSAPSLKSAFTVQTTKDGQETGYGLGWRIAVRDGVREVWHTGGQERVSNVFYMIPEKGIAVAILTNLEKSGPLDLARSIADELLRAKP